MEATGFSALQGFELVKKQTQKQAKQSSYLFSPVLIFCSAKRRRDNVIKKLEKEVWMRSQCTQQQ